MASPIIIPPSRWSKAENDASYTAPMAGPAWEKVGTPVYAPAKFNNGHVCGAPSDYWQTPIDIYQTTLAFWLRPVFSSALTGSNYGIFQEDGYFYLLWNGYYGWTGNWYNFPTNNSNINTYWNPTTAFSAGDDILMLMQFDATALTNAEKVKLWVNNVQQTVLISVGPGNIQATGVNWALRDAGWSAGCGVFDNPYVFQYLFSAEQRLWLYEHESWEDGAPPSRRRILHPIYN